MLSQTGSRQGDTLAQLGFCASMQAIYADAEDEARKRGAAVAIAIYDDLYLVGEVPAVFAGFDKVREHATPENGLVLQTAKSLALWPHARPQSKEFVEGCHARGLPRAVSSSM